MTVTKYSERACAAACHSRKSLAGLSVLILQKRMQNCGPIWATMGHLPSVCCYSKGIGAVVVVDFGWVCDVLEVEWVRVLEQYVVLCVAMWLIHYVFGGCCCDRG